LRRIWARATVTACMKNKSVLFLGVVMVLVFAGVWLWRACTETDEVKIQRVIESGRQAVEDKSLRGVMAVLAPDYHDNLGSTIDTVRPTAQRLFLAVQGLHIDVRSRSEPRVAQAGDHRIATVRLAVVVSGAVQGEPFYLMGTPSEPIEVTIVLVQDGRKWLVRELSGLPRPRVE